jgi:hypothetical protein
MPVTLKSTAEDGTIHDFVSELDTIKDWGVWITETQTSEVIDSWEEFNKTGINTELTSKAYTDWLVAYKLTHTMTLPDGKSSTQSHTNYQK